MCNEEYALGQKISRPAGFHYWPNAEQAYWEHCRTSQKHGHWFQLTAATARDLLARLPTTLAAARIHHKLMHREDLAPLRRLFR